MLLFDDNFEEIIKLALKADPVKAEYHLSKIVTSIKNNRHFKLDDYEEAEDVIADVSRELYDVSEQIKHAITNSRFS